MSPRLVAVLLAGVACGCPTRSDGPSAGAPAEPSPTMIPTPAPHDPNLAPAPASIVFADRTSAAYLLLLPADMAAPTRDDLVALVRRAPTSVVDEHESALLVELITMEPVVDSRLQPSTHPRDLLGLHIELLDASASKAAIPAAMLEDPVATRSLRPAERATLAQPHRALVLRADYRNEKAVRGLRLLQRIVELLARERDALVHDPDTGETVGVGVFAERRLQAGLGNLADQIAVVPFADKRHGEPWVRLTTRGMRRFGSVDLELDGLPGDGKLLQQATWMLQGLAAVMVRMAEIDPSGFPVELDDDVVVTHADIVKAFPNGRGTVPRCSDCQGELSVRLVERPSEPHDPQDHVVARVVAPGRSSQAANYDQPAWVREALRALLGPLS